MLMIHKNEIFLLLSRMVNHYNKTSCMGTNKECIVVVVDYVTKWVKGMLLIVEKDIVDRGSCVHLF